MSPLSRAPLTVLILTVLLGTGPGDAGPDWEGEAHGNAVAVTATETSAQDAQRAASPPPILEKEYSRADLCGTGQASSSSMNADCTGYADGTPLPVCEGTEPLPPLWSRTRAAATDEWTTWTLAQGWVCPEDALPELTVTDFQCLPLAPSVLNIQPARQPRPIPLREVVVAERDHNLTEPPTMRGAGDRTPDTDQRLLSDPRPIPLREVLVAQRDHNLAELPTGRGAGGRTPDTGQRLLSDPRPIPVA
jgi:hypothetical protein